MTVFFWVGWLAYIVQICFGILCLASGLYYIAETIEEYTQASKKVMGFMVYSVLVIYAVLWIGGDISALMCAVGITANILYCCLLQAFPYIQFTSPSFILSVAAFIVKHWVSLNFFAHNYVPYPEVVGYFTICCWVVPFTLLISTSAGENVLPMANNSQPNDVLSHYYSNSKRKRSSFLAVLENFKSKFIPGRGDKHLY